VWIRDHIMKLAKNLCQVTVSDAMMVDPKMTVPVAQPQPSSFTAEARARLERSGAKITSPVEIKAAGNGVIGLSGQIASLEDKLKMSRALRGMPGCTCVKNDLAVPEVVAAGKDIGKAPAADKSAAKHHDLTKPMPPDPVTPIEGTLEKESGFASGNTAQISFDEPTKASGVVQASAKSEKEKK